MSFSAHKFTQPPLRALAYTHAFNFARRYDSKAALSHALAAKCLAIGFLDAAERLQYDSAYFSSRARAYRFRLIGVEPEDGR